MYPGMMTRFADPIVPTSMLLVGREHVVSAA